MVHSWNAPVWASILAALDRLPHALLLSGPRGIGKLALAQHIAARMLCEAAAPGAEACGKCEGCRWFAAGTHPDFRLVQPEAVSLQQGIGVEADEDEEKPASAKKGAKPSAEIKIDQIRALADFLNIGSHRARRRIALVHPAEAMNPNAANSLLKALEEPPPSATFILVSHNASQLLPTIRSRCVVVNLRTPDLKPGADWLASEGVRQAAAWLRFYGGAPLLAKERLEGGKTANLAALLAASAESRGKLLGSVREREDIAMLVDALQKLAFDRALVSAGQPSKYLDLRAEPGSPDQVRHWLKVARSLGEYRAIVDHPLNPILLINQILKEIY